jgi:DNA-binding HxlR family transcriptional regulator
MFRTKQQRKKLYTSCPIARAADIMGDTWSLLIIHNLFSGSKRFGDFETLLTGISTRTLAKKLRFLEEKNIIRRKKCVEKPSHIEYCLTSKGKECNKIISTMSRYSQKYL